MALRLLSLRPHSTEELRRKLLQRRCPPEEVRESLARLTALGYLDDRAFAQQLVAQRSGSRGPVLIAQELGAKGIPRTVIEETLSVLDHDQQVATAGLLASRERREDQGRAAAWLQRRGFSRRAIREALEVLPDVGWDP